MEAMRETLESQRARLSLDVEEGKSGVEQQLKDVEDELVRLYRDDERAILAAGERERREAERRVEEKVEALIKLDEMLGDLDKDFRQKLEALQEKTLATRQEVANVYWAGRKAYTLANDLFALTGDRKYQRPWALKAQLGQHADAVLGYFLPNAPKPLMNKPWEKLLRMARQGV